MGAACSKCGKPLIKTQLLSFCGECRAVTAVHRPKLRLKYQPAGYLERWLKKQTGGKTAREKGLFLLETQFSMGKTAFFRYLEGQNGREAGRRLPRDGGVHTLYFDSCYPSGECGERLVETVKDFCRALQPGFSAPLINDETADKARRFAKLLTGCRKAMDRQGINRPLLLVLDHIDRGGAGKSAVLQYLPEEDQLPAGVFLLVAVNTERLEQNKPLRDRLKQMNFTDSAAFDRNSLGNTMLVRKMISGRLFALNFREKLTDGDLRIERANGSVKNNLTSLGLLNVLLKSKHPSIRTSLEDIPPDTDLAALYLKKLGNVWGEDLSRRMLRWLLCLALLENPVEIGFLGQLAGDGSIAEALAALGNTAGMLEAVQKNGKAALCYCHESLAEGMVRAYTGQAEQLMDELLDRMEQPAPPQGQAAVTFYLAGQIFDMVEQYGTQSQQARLGSDAFLANSAALLRALPQEAYDGAAGAAPWSARVHYLIRNKRYRWLAETYVRRSECHEKAGRFNEAVYDLSAALLTVERYWKGPQREQALVDLYLKRARIYMAFRRLDSAVEDYTYAISQLTAARARGEETDAARLGSLYLQRAGLYKKRRQASYVEEDFGRAIALLEETSPLDTAGKMALTAAYIGRGILYGAAGGTLRAVRDFHQAVTRLEAWIAEDPAPALLEQLATAYGARGNAFSREERYEEAVEELNKAAALREQLLRNNQLEKPSDLARVYLNRGTAYNAMGNYEKAVADYTQAIGLRGASGGDQKDKAMELARAYRNRGVVYGKMGRDDREAEDYTRAIGLLQPFLTEENRDAVESCIKAYRYRGITYRRLGLEDRAEQDKTKQRQLQILLNRAFQA